MPSVSIVHTHLGSAPRGNRTTSSRWQSILEELGWSVRCMPVWDGKPCDVLIALHAERSHDSIVEFRRAHPHRSLVVAATGTDIYNDESDRSLVHESFALATRIIVLQPMALAEIPLAQRDRGRVIFQSLAGPRPEARAGSQSERFDVAYLANARPVKDPLTALNAARLLPAGSAVRILHIGSLMDSQLGARIHSASRGLLSFQSLGSLPHMQALEVLAGCPLALSTSRHEGGANIVTEALALGVPLVVSDIPGSIGLLGSDYPGIFPVGDAACLASLLQRAASDGDYLDSLRRACERRAHIADPELELRSFELLMAELAP